MLHLSRSIFAVISFGLAIYLIITQNVNVIPFVNLALVGLFLTSGHQQLKTKQKMFATFSFIVASFLLLTAIFTYYVFYIYIA